MRSNRTLLMIAAAGLMILGAAVYVATRDYPASTAAAPAAALP